MKENSMELVKLAVMGLNDAKDLKRDCEAQGVELVLNHNDQTCNRGCSVTVEVLAQETDLPIVQKIYSENYQQLLKGHDVNFDIINSVYDTSQDSAVCPACGFKFSTSSSECPDCGLMLG
jgi:hypothetical protein